MPEPLNCLESLVGLTPEALPCFPFPTTGDTAWITTSSRTGSAGGGVYLTQLAGLNFTPAKSDPDTDLYAKLAKARNGAASYVRNAIQQASKYSFGVARYATTGQLGKTGNGSAYQGEASLTLSTTYQEGGGYRITALALQTTGYAPQVPILLDGQQVATLSATNGSLQVLSTPIVIPFDGEAHTLTAALPTGMRPLAGQLHCPGCSGGSPFSLAVGRNLRGVTAGTANAGFLLRVEEACVLSATDVLCYATTNNELADALASAVRAMAAHEFIFEILGLASYSRYTLTGEKQLVFLATEAKEVADKMIAWLAQPTGLGRLDHPCYTCAKQPYGPGITKTY